MRIFWVVLLLLSSCTHAPIAASPKECKASIPDDIMLVCRGGKVYAVSKEANEAVLFGVACSQAGIQNISGE